MTVKNEQLQELFEIARQATVSLTVADLLPALVKAAASFVGHDAASMRLLDPSGTRLTIVAEHGLSADYAPRADLPADEGAVGLVVAEGQPLIVEDVAHDERCLHRAAAVAEGIRSLVFVPLRSRDRIIGTLCTYSRTPRRYSDAEIEFIAWFANVAAVAIENAQLYERAETRAARMKRLSELSQLITSSLDLQKVLEFTTKTILDLLEVDMARLWVVDETAGLLRLSAQASRRPDPEPETGRTEMPLGAGAMGWVVEHRAKRYCADVGDDPIRANGPWLKAHGYVSQLAVPLIVGERALGALSVMTTTRRAFSDEEQELLELFAAKAATAIENARLYAQARAHASALQAKNAELDSFAYAVSHDLKSPLVTIQGMVSMLQTDQAERLDEQGKRYLGRINANVEQMERLISDLLALSRVGREARPSEPVAINEVVDEVLLGLTDRIRARGVKVVCGDLGTVTAIRTQMVQIWSNLVSNAVKYLGDTPAPTVEIGCTGRGPVVEYWVRDNGIGIDPAYHAKVFEMFQRLKEIEAEGTGVGLPIVKKIVESVGGRLRVESAQGQGATFFFTWPKTKGG